MASDIRLWWRVGWIIYFLSYIGGLSMGSIFYFADMPTPDREVLYTYVDDIYILTQHTDL